MRVNDLNEAAFANFADHAVDAVDKITSAAASAYGKFMTAKEKAKQEIIADTKAAAQEKEEADKAAEKNKPPKPIQNIPNLVAKVTLDRTPNDPSELEEFHKFDIEDFNQIYAAIDKSEDRISNFEKELKKALKASDFLQDQHKDDAELNDMLGEQPARGNDSAETMLLKNAFDEQSAWSEVMVSDNIAHAAQKMVSLMKAISRDFQRKNLAALSQNKNKKTFPEGTGIVRIISTQRQIIKTRLGLLKLAIDKLAEKPVSEACLARVRKLLERMK